MSFKTLMAYQKAFDSAMQIFKISKSFPAEEKFSLTSQIVRSSRGVCSAIAEAYRKRDYEKHFKSKLTDADNENSETQLWLDFAAACNYILKEEHDNLLLKSEEVGNLLNYMIINTTKFGVEKS